MDKVIGDIAGVPNPKSDWGQNDERKADYIKNKPDLTVFANALKETVSGSAICITDISPVEHNMGVKISGVDDLSTVKLYKQGKNWFNEKAITKKTETTVEVDGVSYEVYDINGYTKDYLYTTNSSFRFDVYMKKGKDYTVSLIWMGSSDEKNQTGSLYMPFKDVKGGNQCFDNMGAGSDVLNAFDVFGRSKNPLTKITFRITPTEDIVKGALCYYSFGVKGYVLKDSIQIEEGTATEYEPYIEPIMYDVPTDGIVEGVKSLYPSTTLYTDTQGAVIDVEYNKDINKAFAELQAMILEG